MPATVRAGPRTWNVAYFCCLSGKYPWHWIITCCPIGFIEQKPVIRHPPGTWTQALQYLIWLSQAASLTSAPNPLSQVQPSLILGSNTVKSRIVWPTFWHNGLDRLLGMPPSNMCMKSVPGCSAFIWLSANMYRKAAEVFWILASDTHLGNVSGDPGSWFWLDPCPAVVLIWGLNQRLKDLLFVYSSIVLLFK